jgi:hypothetical protein
MKSSLSKKSETWSKKKEGNKASFFDVTFFVIPLLWFFLGTIFFREFLYGNNPKFYSLWIDAAVVFFLGLLLIRLVQGELKKHSKNSKKIQFTFLFISSLPILYGIVYKWYSLWYYLRDITLYGIPTLIMVYFLMRYSVYVLHKQERVLKKYNEMHVSEIPQYVQIGEKLIKIKNRWEIEQFYREYGENIEVIVEKSSPFGHYIFASFIITALTPVNLAHIILSQWYYLLSSIWEFLRQWI